MACYLGMEAIKPLVNLVPEISGDLNSHNFDLENLRHLDLVPENPMFGPLGPWAPTLRTKVGSPMMIVPCHEEMAKTKLITEWLGRVHDWIFSCDPMEHCMEP